MTVNGLQLPEAFVALIGRSDLPYAWAPKKDAVDPSGQPLNVLPLELSTDLARIEKDTAVLSRLFREEHRFPDLPPLVSPEPLGSVDTDDISRLVWFGSTASGEPYCFDFREDLAEPGVLYWDGEWRRLASNFAAFMRLFEPDDES